MAHFVNIRPSFYHVFQSINCSKISFLEGFGGGFYDGWGWSGIWDKLSNWVNFLLDCHLPDLFSGKCFKSNWLLFHTFSKYKEETSSFHFPRTVARGTMTVVLVGQDKGILSDKKRGIIRFFALLWWWLRRVTSSFSPQQNLICEQLGGKWSWNAEEPRKYRGCRLDLFLGRGVIVVQIDGDGG